MKERIDKEIGRHLRKFGAKKNTRVSLCLPVVILSTSYEKEIFSAAH